MEENKCTRHNFGRSFILAKALSNCIRTTKNSRMNRRFFAIELQPQYRNCSFLDKKAVQNLGNIFLLIVMTVEVKEKSYLLIENAKHNFQLFLSLAANKNGATQFRKRKVPSLMNRTKLARFKVTNMEDAHAAPSNTMVSSLHCQSMTIKCLWFLHSSSKVTIINFESKVISILTYPLHFKTWKSVAESG